MSQSSLDHFVTQMRAAQDRGLPLTANDVLEGLQFALVERRGGTAIRYAEGIDHVENIIRSRLEAHRTPRQQAEAGQQTILPFAQKSP
jgi:hypothetical protein